MLEIIIGFLSFNSILFIIGIMLQLKALEATLIAFAVICFIGGYLARSSKTVRKMANWIGGICVVFVVIFELVLPMIQGTGKTWVIFLSFMVASICYIIVRKKYLYKKLVKRNPETGNRPQAPFNKEWARWLIFFLV